MLYADVVARYRDEITQTSAYIKVAEQHAKNEESVQALAQSINQLQVEVDRMRSTSQLPPTRTRRQQGLQPPNLS
jgi:palmitoyltransferase